MSKDFLYKDIPTIPMEIPIKDLDHFYRVVGVLNRTAGKNNWKGPKKIVRKLRSVTPWHVHSLPCTFWIFEDKKEEIQFLLKLSF